MTLRLYARGKGLPLDGVLVRVGHSRQRNAETVDLFTRRLHIESALTGE